MPGMALFSLAFLLIGSAFVAASILAFKGRYRSWRIMRFLPGYGPYIGLAPAAIMGGVVLILGAYTPFMVRGGEDVAPAGQSIFIISIIFFGLVSSFILSFKMPQSWIPQWLKDVEEEEARQREIQKRLREQSRRRR